MLCWVGLRTKGSVCVCVDKSLSPAAFRVAGGTVMSSSSSVLFFYLLKWCMPLPVFFLGGEVDETPDFKHQGTCEFY